MYFKPIPYTLCYPYLPFSFWVTRRPNKCRKGFSWATTLFDFGWNSKKNITGLVIPGWSFSFLPKFIPSSLLHNGNTLLVWEKETNSTPKHDTLQNCGKLQISKKLISQHYTHTQFLCIRKLKHINLNWAIHLMVQAKRHPLTNDTSCLIHAKVDRYASLEDSFHTWIDTCSLRSRKVFWNWEYLRRIGRYVEQNPLLI